MKLNYDEPLSSFAFNFNLRRYISVVSAAAAAGRLAGFPVPDVAGRAKEFLDKSGQELANLRGEAAEEVARALHLDARDVAEQLEALSHDVAERAEAYAEGGSDDSGDSEENLKVRRRAVELGRAAAEIAQTVLQQIRQPSFLELNAARLKFSSVVLWRPLPLGATELRKLLDAAHKAGPGRYCSPRHRHAC